MKVLNTYLIYNNMPYTLRKLPRKQCYRVYNKDTKKVFAKCSIKGNAQKQIRLLHTLHGISRRRKGKK